MFCDRCGMQLAGTGSYCPSCGKSFYVYPVRGCAAGRVEAHVRRLGIFWIVYSLISSGFKLLGAWWFSRFFRDWGSFWDPNIPFPFAGFMHGLGLILAAGGLLGIIAGWGLMERQSWARMLAIVLGFLALPHFGLGTALGIYTLWVLLPAQSAAEYERAARAM